MRIDLTVVDLMRIDLVALNHPRRQLIFWIGEGFWCHEVNSHQSKILAVSWDDSVP